MNSIIPLLLSWIMPASEDWVQSSWNLSPAPDEIAIHDLNGDGLSDLILAIDNHLSIYLQNSQSGFDAKPNQDIHLEGRALAWDIADIEGDGLVELVVMSDGDQVRAWRRAKASEPGEVSSSILLPEDTLLLENAGGFLPDGCRYAPFVADMDSDGDGDIVVPTQGHCALFLRGEDGEFTRGPKVGVPIRISINMWGGQYLDTEIYESVRVPLFRIKDVNGDSRPDLISKTEERLSYYLADPVKGVPVEPTFTLEVASLEKKLKGNDDDSFDINNIFAGITNRVEVRSDDVDGDGRIDFVVRSGPKISLFLGKDGGVDFDGRPDDLKKVSGNVITHFLHDDNGDGLLDLHIVRIEAVSITEVLFWLVTAGTLDLDLFIYHNEGQPRLPKKPSRQWSLGLEFPPLLGFMGRADEMAETLKKKSKVNAFAANLDNRGERNDVFVLPADKNVVKAYFNAVPSGWRESWTSSDFFESLKRQINYESEEDSYKIDLEKFDQWIPLPSHELELETQKLPPDMTWALDPPGKEFHRPDAIALQLNGDTKDDLLVAMREKSRSRLYLTCFVSTQAPN